MFESVTAPSPTLADLPYQPFYCEEVAWQILARDLIAGPAEALLIANPSGRVACWGSRAAEPDEPVGWDYHVVAVELGPEVRIWDPDCRLGPVLAARDWLHATFLTPELVRPRFHPRFRPVPRAEWIAELRTDRSHMRRADGRYRRPPPAWDPPGPGMNLMQWLAQDHPDWIDRAALEARYRAG